MKNRVLDSDDLATRRSTAVLRFVEGSSAKQLDDLEELFDRHEKQGVKTFLLDLDGVNYISSTALATFVKLRREALARGNEFQLINVSHHIHEILRTTRLLKFFFDDEY